MRPDLEMEILPRMEDHLNGRRFLSEVDLDQVSRLLDSSANTLNSAASFAESSRDIFVCAIDAFKTLKQLENAVKMTELRVKESVEKTAIKSDHLHRTLDQLLNQSNSLLERALAMDVDQCSDRQLDSRDKYIEIAMKLNDQAHAQMMQFLSM